MSPKHPLAWLGLAAAMGSAVGGLASCIGDEPMVARASADASSVESGGEVDGAIFVADGATSMDGGADGASPACDASPCVVQISAGGSHSCVRLLDGTVRCWGWNARGESGGGVVSLDAGSLFEDVTPRAYPTPHAVANLPSATVVGTGGAYRADGVSCAATSDLKMSCWGFDRSQQLGRGGAARSGDVSPAPARPEPAVVVQISNVRDISVGVRHVCAIFTAGAVACWGGDTGGAIGLPPTGATYGIAQTLAAPVQFDRVVSRGQHNLALTKSKKVWSWGNNDDGQHGIAPTVGTPGVPEEIAALNGTYSDIAAGRFHGCALDTTGKVWCWGKASDGQLGRGPGATGPAPATVAFAAGKIVTRIAGDEQHMLALLDDGSVYEWGTLITGSALPPDPRGATIDAPTQVPLPKRATQVAAGFEHSCVLLEGGAVWCWGNNRGGELGRGTIDDGIKLAPGPVVF